MVKNKLANVTKKADLKENMWVKLKTCFAIYCKLYLAIITFGWPFEHIVESTKSLGMGQTNPLFCNAGVSKMSRQTTLPY